MENMIKLLQVISGILALFTSLATIAVAGRFRNLKFLVIGLALLVFTCFTAVYLGAF